MEGGASGSDNEKHRKYCGRSRHEPYSCSIPLANCAYKQCSREPQAEAYQKEAVNAGERPESDTPWFSISATRGRIYVQLRFQSGYPKFRGRAIAPVVATIISPTVPIVIKSGRADFQSPARKALAACGDRGDLVILATAGKRYDNLTIHVWNRGGGKSAFRSQSSELIEGIAATINSKPHAPWLVILHKEDEGYTLGKKRIPDLMKLICDLVTNPENVSSLTWGNEKATNEYCHVNNVILAGTLFYPTSLYEVRARACKGIRAEDRLDMDELKLLEMGSTRTSSCRRLVEDR